MAKGLFILTAVFWVIMQGSECFSASSCRFGAATGALNFGSIDSASASDVEVITTMTFRCTGPPQDDPVPFTITDDDGLYETGPNQNRMRNTIAPSEYLPYSFEINPSSGFAPRLATLTFSIKGIIKATDYQNAYIGPYSDTITLTINP